MKSRWEGPDETPIDFNWPDISSSGDDCAEAQRIAVHNFRTEALVPKSEDFAYLFVEYEEAYYNAGRAVAATSDKRK